MKTKILKTVIYIFGLVCLVAFLAIRSLPLMNRLMAEKIIPGHWEFVKYGEMYYFNYISDFKVDSLPKATQKFRLSAKQAKLDRAEILIFGDSFFDFARHENLPEQIHDWFNMPVYFERNDYPLASLAQKGYENEEPKILIYETVERNIAYRFREKHKIPGNPEKANNKDDTSFKNTIIEFLFPQQTEELYNKVLQRSYITTKIYEWIATLKFNLFGYVSRLTPKYTLKNQEDPWLFYHREVSDEHWGFYYQHSEKEINTYCNNIADLAAKLEKEFSLKMVFVVVPNKYTIYHTMLNDHTYNDLLPDIYKGLEKRNIPVVKLYKPYLRNKGEKLYHGTDTHWNQQGIDIAVNKTIKVIENGLKPYVFAETKKSQPSSESNKQ
jgi:hypothetical protein